MVILLIALLGLLGVGALAFLYFGPDSSTRTDPVIPNAVFTGISLEERAERLAENKRRLGRIRDIEKRGAGVSDVRELASFLDPAVPYWHPHSIIEWRSEGYAQVEARRVLKSLGDDARPELLKLVKNTSLPAMQRAKSLSVLCDDADLALFEEVLAMSDAKFIVMLSSHGYSRVVDTCDRDEFTRWFEANKHRYVFNTKECRFCLADVKKDP